MQTLDNNKPMPQKHTDIPVSVCVTQTFPSIPFYTECSSNEFLLSETKMNVNYKCVQ
jgi:hypothetical protein